ncbi:MAG: opioid growth factor receptor-related protein [Parashewanella sp.]
MATAVGNVEIPLRSKSNSVCLTHDEINTIKATESLANLHSFTCCCAKFKNWRQNCDKSKAVIAFFNLCKATYGNQTPQHMARLNDCLAEGVTVRYKVTKTDGVIDTTITAIELIAGENKQPLLTRHLAWQPTESSPSEGTTENTPLITPPMSTRVSRIRSSVKSELRSHELHHKMTTMWIKFMLSDDKMPGCRYLLSQIRSFNDEQLESNQGYIQALFPIPQHCTYHEYAPILTQEMVLEILQPSQLRLSVQQNLTFMLTHWGIAYNADEKKFEICDRAKFFQYLDQANSQDNQHRMTRVLNFLMEVQFKLTAFQIYTLLSRDCSRVSRSVITSWQNIVKPPATLNNHEWFTTKHLPASKGEPVQSQSTSAEQKYKGSIMSPIVTRVRTALRL